MSPAGESVYSSFGKMEYLDFLKSKIELATESGNSIVRDVLMAIFSQLNIKGVPMWNEVHHGTK